jgi:hypothetical protein
MADFVAVIRRAVDGLATNTPEARTRVYEKARGAVQRQLENMKPRPPEEMLRRQMDKLEAAIVEVETEHAEALPAEPEVAATPAPVPYQAPEPVEEYVQEPEAAAEPQHAEDYAAPHSHVETYRAESYREEEPAAAEPAAEPYREPETHWEEAPHAEPVATHDWREAGEEPAAERYGDWRDDVPEEKVEYPQQVAVEETAYSHEADSREEASPFAEDRHETHSFADRAFEERDATPAEWPVEPYAPTQDYVAAETVSPDHTTWVAPEAEPVHQAEGHRADSVWNEVDDLTRHLDAGHRSAPVAAHFGEEMHASAEPVRMPTATDMPQASKPADEADEDPFAAYVNAQPSAPVEQPKPAQAQPQQDERDPWSDLEDLIGYTKDAPASEQKPQKAADEDDFSDLLSPPAKPYRVTPVRKRNYAGMILGLLALIIIGGGAYGAWMYRDKLNDLVGGLMPTGSSSSETAQQTPPASAPDNSGTPAQTPAAQPQQSASPPAQPQTTTPPPADGSSTATKFTQRLLENGSEVDAGPGDAGSLAQNAEGQSVAQLNAPPADPAPAAPSANGTTAPPAAGAAPATPGASAAEVPAAAGEKMFLYEERIGQSAPTAIEGTVSWSLQREPGPNGGPAEPVVQGRITVPGRGLTALLTVKKNSDSSLPASHLIEIVFAVPPDFEGGAIDSVLRIAMKQTEQDRGNALVAVPAKITDDFHMIALNDFPDAQRTNLELLRTRNWIDIPLAYRNGRRALLTLQKGPEGVKAFDEAIREWSQNTSGQTGQ